MVFYACVYTSSPSFEYDDGGIWREAEVERRGRETKSVCISRLRKGDVLVCCARRAEVRVNFGGGERAREELHARASQWTCPIKLSEEGSEWSAPPGQRRSSE